MFESDQGVPLERAEKIDALDSLAKNGDQPGQLIFRTGVWLGQWLERASQKSEAPLEVIEAELDRFIHDGSDLLGEEIDPGVFLRYVNPGEQRPTGIHLFHPKSRCLLTVESYDSEQERRSVALSLKSSLFASAADDDWNRFKQKVHELFPYFQPAKGGSGPQRRKIPFFVSAIQTDWESELKELPKKLRELMQIVEPEKTELEENPSA